MNCGGLGCRGNTATILTEGEDAGEKISDIPVPPKYTGKDFLDNSTYKLRGKLDVPKERFISYPHCESDKDPQPIYGWAGWNHAQRAQALAALYVDRKDNEAWTPERLTPMLAGILELLPWLKQWHNEVDADLGVRLGDFYETWLDGELHSLKLTRKQLEDWRPPKKSGKRKKKAAKKAKET